MISDALLSGLVAAFSAIMVALINNQSTRKLMEFKIQELKEEVSKHNRVIERVYELEKQVAVLQKVNTPDDGK